MLQHLASLDSIVRSFIATVARLLAAMLITAGLGMSGRCAAKRAVVRARALMSPPLWFSAF